MTLRSAVSCGLEVQGQGPGQSWVRRGGTRERPWGEARRHFPNCCVPGPFYPACPGPGQPPVFSSGGRAWGAGGEAVGKTLEVGA